ncbi:efflux RND transporter permease subunit, partial [Serratia marcescens]|uniref:efflux RND transporter permease subunit n=1 Tax=Serratia marcescens TaxID=615 RepID=UPI001115275A
MFDLAAVAIEDPVLEIHAVDGRFFDEQQLVGADAEVMDRSVTAVIEKELNGVDNFLYMASTSRSNGTAQITVTFKPGTNLDVARTQVQDRLSRAEPRLPQEVRALGIQVTEGSAGFLEVITL